MRRTLLCVSYMLLLLVACSREAPQPQSTTQINSATPTPASSNNATVPSQQNQVPSNIVVVDISERNNNGKNGIAVTFNAPIDGSRDIQPYFAITQADGSLVEGAWQLGDKRKIAWYMDTEPQTNYTVKVSPGLLAENNTQLLSAASTQLTTRRLMPSVNFDSDGMVLPVGYVSGLPVVTVNIDAVDVDFFRIKEDSISDFINQARSARRNSWYTRQLKNFGELVYSGRFDLSAPHNTRVKRDLDIKNISALKKPGMYLAVMRAAGVYENLEVTWFSISDIGLHLRQYRAQLDVHVASLTRGKALPNVELEIRDNANRIIQQATTTPQGQASFTGNLSGGEVLIARTRDQYTLLDLKQPALDLSDFDIGDRPQLANELFLYAPRDLYRPGELADFNALLRDYDGKLQQSPVLSAELRNPLGAAVKSFKWPSQELGYYHYSWQIPDTAPTGQWQLVVTGIMGKAVVYHFNIEEFLPERMKLTLDDGEPRSIVYAAAETAHLNVLGEYLYGAPASGNKFDAMLQVSQWRSPIDTLKDFQFGDVLDSNFTPQVKLNELFLDSEGKGTLNIESSWQQIKSPLEVRVVGSLYESGGRPVTRAHSILVWPNENLPGIRPEFGDSNPTPGGNAGFDVVVANVNGELSARPELQATLVKEDRQYFWEYNQHRGWHWNWSEKEFAVATETFASNAKTPVTVSFPVEWGRYRLEVVDLETKLKSSVRFFAGRDWYYDWKNASKDVAARPDKVNLALDKDRYNPGEVAELKILPPAQGEVLLLVESDRPLWAKKLTVSEQGTTVQIPIDVAWDTHNIYVSALLLQPSGEKVKQTPKRAMGLIHLPLNRDSRKLDITIQAPQKSLPGVPLQAKIKFSNAKPLPDDTRVTLAAVDVGVLNITDFKTPDPFGYFFGQRRYDIDARDMYSDIIEVSQAEKAHLRFGGDADLVRGGMKPKSEVQIVSLFEGPIKANAQGEAEVSLQLPDFNGRLRLMAVGFSDLAYGNGESEVTVAAEVVTEIAMPRFLAYGDSAQIALDLHNTTEKPVDLKLNLSTEFPLQLIAHEHELSLKPNEKTTLNFPVKAIGFEGGALVTAAVSSAQITDFSRRWQLGVRPAYPALTTQLQEVIDSGETFKVTEEDLSGAILETLQAAISVSPVIDLQIGEQLRNLLAYPYGCLEQTSSRGWPLTFATQERQKAFNMEPLSDKERYKRIQKAVDRVISFQRNNGSFGLWSSDAYEAHWLTVYATDFLLQARKVGADVPQAQLDRAINRLQNYLNSSGGFVHQRWSQNAEHYAFATRAYAALVLSQLQRASLGTLRNLYRRDFQKAKSGYSQLQLGLALLNMGDHASSEQAITQALQNFNNEYRYWGDYGSPIRDLGMAIHLLAPKDAYKDTVFKLSVALRNAVHDRNWLSTQERFALFMAGMALQQNFSEVWQGQWQLGSTEPQPVKQNAAWLKNLDGEQLQAGFQFNNNQKAPLYAGAILSAYGAEAPKPESNGIQVTRHWFNLKGEPVAPKKVKTGELYLVHLAITSDKRVADALLVNLLPAGFELENPNLNKSINFENIQIEGEKLSDLIKNTALEHEEFRDDRYVAAFDQKTYNVSHLVFAVRAVTPGIYRVPPPLVEDMYRPEIRAVGETLHAIEIVK